MSQKPDITITFPRDEAEALAHAVAVIDADNASFGSAAAWRSLLDAGRRIDDAIESDS